MDVWMCSTTGQPMQCNLHIQGSVISSDQPILLWVSTLPLSPHSCSSQVCVWRQTVRQSVCLSLSLPASYPVFCPFTAAYHYCKNCISIPITGFGLYLLKVFCTVLKAPASVFDRRLSDSPGGGGGGKKEGLSSSLSRHDGRRRSSQHTPEVDPQTILKALFKSSSHTATSTQSTKSQATDFRINV